MFLIDLILSGPLIKILSLSVFILAPTFFNRFNSVLIILGFKFLISRFPIPFYLGGTSVLIVVVVAMDTVSQVQTRLMSQQYETLIKKTKFGK